jgi:tRNA A37 threonylcarbamoyladenosine dehydratase
MLNQFSRTELLVGKENVEKLNKSKVAIFGIGGVGSFVVEALARSGVGKFVLIDNDTISMTNINRQLHATTKTIGQKKVEVMKDRILEINPDAEVITHFTFITPENTNKFIPDDCDYIVDAIDTITSKIAIVVKAKEKNIKIISSMGAGNKLNPTMFEVADISKTSVCPVAKVMRKELRKRNINSLKVVYSKETPLKPVGEVEKEDITKKRQVPGSVSFVPSVAGLIIASEIVKDLIK